MTALSAADLLVLAQSGDGGGGAAGILIAIFVIFVLVAIVVQIIALVDVIRTPEGSFKAGSKVIWVLVVLFLGLLGAIIYYFVGRPARR